MDVVSNLWEDPEKLKPYFDFMVKFYNLIHKTNELINNNVIICTVWHRKKYT